MSADNHSEFLKWVEIESPIDSGATITIAKVNTWWKGFDSVKSAAIRAFDGQVSRSMGSGTAIGIIEDMNGEKLLLQVPKAHRVRGARTDLLSMDALLEQGYDLSLSKNKGCFLTTPDNKIIRLKRENGLLWLRWFKAVDKREDPKAKSIDVAFGAEVAKDPEDSICTPDGECLKDAVSHMNEVPNEIASAAGETLGRDAKGEEVCEGADPNVVAGTDDDDDDSVDDSYYPQNESLNDQDIEAVLDRNPSRSSYFAADICGTCTVADEINCSDRYDDEINPSCEFCEMVGSAEACEALFESFEEAEGCNCLAAVATVAPRRAASVTMDLMHRRLGHFNTKYIAKMRSDKTLDVNVVGSDKGGCCSSCRMSKATRHNPPVVRESTDGATDTPFASIYSDVKGKLKKDFFGNKYMVTFTCEYTRWTAVYFCRRKSEVVERFADFLVWVRTQRYDVKYITTDGGGEYGGPENASNPSSFQQLCLDGKIKQRWTAANTQGQNGVSERYFRVESLYFQTMLLCCKMLFWTIGSGHSL